VPDFALPPEIEDLREAAARFAERELAPAARDAEAAGGLSEGALSVLEGFSLRRLDLPERLGGAGAGVLAKVVVLEALAYGDAGGLFGADQPGPVAGAIAACPDVSTASRVADDCVAGRSGCALAADDTRSVAWAPAWPRPRWIWTTTADTLSLHEFSGAPDETVALAFHASGGVSVDLDAPPVGSWELGPHMGVTVRGRARLWTAAIAIGVGQAALDATVAYTTDRVVFGKPVAHHQGNAFDLAVAATDLHGARLAIQDAARRFDSEDPDAGFWATQAWITTIDAAARITDLGIQLLGGHGFLVDHLAEKRFREVGMLRLLFGGRDAADADVASLTLDVRDPVFA
jgi:alkylation response protein AidB-like acyl-CoA dehydrogenase